jgi:hypothetical protein
VLVEGNEWAHMEALDPDAGYWARGFAQLVNWRARGEKAVNRPVAPSAAELVCGPFAARTEIPQRARSVCQ